MSNKEVVGTDRSTWTKIIGANYVFKTDVASGTLTVRLIDDAFAFGQLTYNTHLIPPFETHMIYTGVVSGNGSTGHTTIKGEAYGERFEYRLGYEHIKGAINIEIAPGFQTATFSVKGLVGNVECHATKIITGPGN